MAGFDAFTDDELDLIVRALANFERGALTTELWCDAAYEIMKRRKEEVNSKNGSQRFQEHTGRSY